MVDTPLDFIEGGAPLVISITLDAGQTVVDIKTEKFPPFNANVYFIQVVFPSGCAQLVKVGIFRNEAKQYPANEGAWLSGHNEVIPITTDINSNQADEWSLRGFNTDDTFEHTITARLYVRRINYEPLTVKIDRLERTIADLAGAMREFIDLWKVQTPEPETETEPQKVTNGDENE